jgi:hypothetical protein
MISVVGSGTGSVASASGTGGIDGFGRRGWAPVPSGHLRCPSHRGAAVIDGSARQTPGWWAFATVTPRAGTDPTLDRAPFEDVPPANAHRVRV